MNKYYINRTSTEFEISFEFNKTYTIISSVISLLLFLIVFVKVNIDYFIGYFYLTGFFIALIYISLNGWFEWRKHKFHKLSILDEDLMINNDFYCKIWNIKSVNISYNVNQLESGWTIYLHRYLNYSNYIIKKRLREKDAYIIAEELSSFLDKPIVKDN